VPGARFINDWGYPRSGGRFHEGNDLFADRGTPVYAPISGVVTQLIGSIGGLQFTLVGDDGHTYYGTHLDSFGEDGWVLAGSLLGTVGDTGNARGSKPHLHFEIYPDGAEPVNRIPPWSPLAPEAWLVGQFRVGVQCRIFMYRMLAHEGEDLFAKELERSTPGEPIGGNPPFTRIFAHHLDIHPKQLGNLGCVENRWKVSNRRR